MANPTSVTNSEFGKSVVINDGGDVIAVGSPFDNQGVSGGKVTTGLVQIFAFSPASNTWIVNQTITPTGYTTKSGGTLNLAFGWSMSMSGNGGTLAVGAWGNSPNGGVVQEKKTLPSLLPLFTSINEKTNK